ncbi:MAG: S-adenosylmethionine:tRNA ribosyltransferase-isomerase [Planctomycetes bacterium]|nr:S-adenosylmethionine:tRNA ribosyltransferase-isomerase [Planctomycetota bacterium]
MNQSNLNPHKLNPSGLPPDDTSDAPPTSALPPDFDVCELDYDLPEELIAQRPPEKRGSSRLLIVNRASLSMRLSKTCRITCKVATHW